MRITVLLFLTPFFLNSLNAKPSFAKTGSIDSLKLEHYYLQPLTIDLGLNNSVQKKSKASYFFKPFGLTILTGVGVGAIVGLTSGGTEDLSSGDLGLIVAAYFGMISIGIGTLIGAGNFIYRTEKDKKEERYRILND